MFNIELKNNYESVAHRTPPDWRRLSPKPVTRWETTMASNSARCPTCPISRGSAVSGGLQWPCDQSLCLECDPSLRRRRCCCRSRCDRYRSCTLMYRWILSDLRRSTLVDHRWESTRLVLLCPVDPITKTYAPVHRDHTCYWHYCAF